MLSVLLVSLSVVSVWNFGNSLLAVTFLFGMALSNASSQFFVSVNFSRISNTERDEDYHINLMLPSRNAQCSHTKK